MALITASASGTQLGGIVTGPAGGPIAPVGSLNATQFSPDNRYKPNPQKKELIGAKSFTLVHAEFKYAAGPPIVLTAGTAFTVTTFDTTTRTDAARLLLTNGSADTMVETACAIKALPIYRLSGEDGYIHDKYIDYESIAMDGDKLFELGNNMVVTLAQVNMLADIHWKRNKTKRHIYTVTFPGFLSYFEPGEWYTLQIGSAGHPEYIDSVVECYAIRDSIGASGIGSSQIDFREVYQNWVFDSNETARFLASGGYQRKPTTKTIVVAASTYTNDDANSYCDGVDDDEEINAAIVYASAIGATVQLTDGTYKITNPVELLPNVALVGMGWGTILEGDVDNGSYVISAVGSVGDTIDNIRISDLMVSRKSENGNNVYAIKLDYVDGASINNVKCYDINWVSIYANHSTAITVTNCLIDGANNDGAWIGIYMTAEAQIVGNIVRNLTGGGQNVTATHIDGDAPYVVANNIITDCISKGTGGEFAYGIVVSSENSIISGNKIENIKNDDVAANVQAININEFGVSNQISNNYCFNNGADTGLGNDNGCNFHDGGTDTQVG